MSRKDYVAIAAAIRAEREAWAGNPDEERYPAYEALQCATESIANVLAVDNPNFNRDRFMEAALGKDNA